MPKPIKLGILVPSSNTSLEPLTTAIISSLPSNDPASTSTAGPRVTVHFSRFSVTSISLSAASTSQFALPAILAAAQLLADAGVDMIGWSGTSSGWLGLDADDALCGAITRATGIRATTSVAALNAALARLGVRRLGLLTPYARAVQEAIVANYAAAGVAVVDEVHLGIADNLAIAEIEPGVLDRGIREVWSGAGRRLGEAEAGRGRVQAITTFCTNLSAAHRVAGWEAEVGVPVLDTVATVVWDMLRKCGIDTAPLARQWGSLFEL
ncbi:hypothetical protein MBLNU459_g1315t1 [Dothideomycetes sp. NU459]